MKKSFEESILFLAEHSLTLPADSLFCQSLVEVIEEIKTLDPAGRDSMACDRALEIMESN